MTCLGGQSFYFVSKQTIHVAYKPNSYTDPGLLVVEVFFLPPFLPHFTQPKQTVMHILKQFGNRNYQPGPKKRVCFVNCSC